MSDPIPVNIAMPCAGNAFAMGPRSDYRIACWACERCQDNGGKCLGDAGWPIMAVAAAEVARERGEGLVMAFAQGAMWWEWQKENASMWQSDQAAAWNAGEQRLRNNTLGRKPPFPPDMKEATR